MARKKGDKPLNQFELDVIRLGYRNGWSDAAIARAINRPRQSVRFNRLKMQKAGTIGQLCLPGFEVPLDER